jgi:hypothetical protein
LKLTGETGIDHGTGRFEDFAITSVAPIAFALPILHDRIRVHARSNRARILPMLTFFDRDSRHNRRAFLRIGGSVALGAGGLTLSDVANLSARGGETPGLMTGKSFIFLFLHGGPSQTETFDPKMAMPEGIRSVTG